MHAIAAARGPGEVEMSARPAGARVAPLYLYSAAGNRFALLDALRDPPAADPAALARELCAEAWREPAGFRPDGLLVLERARGVAAFAMVLYNADGSRPEMCGNGLRVVGDHALRAGHAEPGTIAVETDAGVRRLALERGARGDARVRALVAAPRIVGGDAALDAGGRSRRASFVDAGNPHCVIFVDDPEREDLDAIGRALQRDARFPSGVNVELVARAGAGLAMRVYERGVGETLSCGTGACSAAIAALAAGVLESAPVTLACRGGALEVDHDAEGNAWLSGPLEKLGVRAAR